MKDERVWCATSGTYVTNPRAAMSPAPYRVFSEEYAAALVDVTEAAWALRVANDDLMERKEEYPDDAYVEAWVRFSATLNRLEDAKASGEHA